MNNCEIEIDFVRQSFRVIRNPAVLQLKESRTSSFLRGTLKQDDSRKRSFSKRQLSIGITPPIGRKNTVDKVRSVKKKGVRDSRKDVTAGSIFTSIHVPLKPDNNFERVFNEMLPDADSTEGRCFCHLRPKADVDVNKMMLELMNDLCKSTVPKPVQTPKTVHSKRAAFRESKSKSFQSMLHGSSTFWIGAEYRYNAEMNTLMLKFVLLGTPPQHQRGLYVDVRVAGRKKNKVRRIGLKESASNGIIMGKEISIQMTSFQNTLEERVHVQLEAKKGFLRITKHIDEWEFPLDDCNCMYQRSYWRNVKQTDGRR